MKTMIIFVRLRTFDSSCTVLTWIYSPVGIIIQQHLSTETHRLVCMCTLAIDIIDILCLHNSTNTHTWPHTDYHEPYFADDSEIEWWWLCVDQFNSRSGSSVIISRQIADGGCHWILMAFIIKIPYGVNPKNKGEAHTNEKWSFYL